MKRMCLAALTDAFAISTMAVAINVASAGDYDGETGYSSSAAYGGAAYASAAYGSAAYASRALETVPRIKNREEAIGKCLVWTKEHIPPDTMHSPGRTFGYWACMSHVGHRP